MSASLALAEEGMPPSGPRPAAFQDSAGLHVLQRLAAALREAEGYRCTEARRAKGIEAGFGCELAERCTVTVLLGVSRANTGIVRFYLMTRWFPPTLGRLLGRPAGLELSCIRRWCELLDAVDRQLKRALGAPEVEWPTHDDASKGWE